MESSIDQVLSAAMKLDESSRAQIVQKLLDSLDESGLEEEWADLAEKRLEEIKSGKTTTISWDQLKANIS